MKKDESTNSFTGHFNNPNRERSDWEVTKDMGIYELDEIVKPRPQPPTLWELNKIFARRCGNLMEVRLSSAQEWVPTDATLTFAEKLAIN